jgi:hypothetical protein
MKRHKRHDSVDKVALLKVLREAREAVTGSMRNMRIHGALYASALRSLEAIDDVVEKLGEDRRRLHDKGTSH